MDLKKLPKTEFAAAVAQIAGERDIDSQLILDSIEAGLISAYKRDQKEHGVIVLEDAVFEVDLVPETGSFRVFQINGDQKTDVTPPGFGRIAAQTAKQVIDQRIREAERDVVIAQYQKKVGTILFGTILRVDHYRITVGIGKTEGVCPKDDQIKNELLSLGMRKLFLLREIKVDVESGKSDIVLSRRDPEFIKQLFAREVPEVDNGSVVIEKIAREAGDRAKVAVSSTQPGIDPVGTCIGQKGSRIQAVLNELPASEKVDVIAFTKNINQFIINALSPAQDAKVISLRQGIATVLVPEGQLALAIGSGGENVRLAGILTDTDIKVQSEVQKTSKAKK